MDARAHEPAEVVAVLGVELRLVPAETRRASWWGVIALLERRVPRKIGLQLVPSALRGAGTRSGLTAKPPVCRDFAEGERRDSNPRPPGPQPGKSGSASVRFGSRGSFESSSVVFTSPHFVPRFVPRRALIVACQAAEIGVSDGRLIARSLERATRRSGSRSKWQAETAPGVPYGPARLRWCSMPGGCLGRCEASAPHGNAVDQRYARSQRRPGVAEKRKSRCAALRALDEATRFHDNEVVRVLREALVGVVRSRRW